MRRLRKFAVLPPDDRRLTVEAAAWLALALALLALLPFRWIAARLGTPAGGAGLAVPPPADAGQRAVALRIGRAVERAARHLPWSARCLPQAIAAKAMLHRRGIASTMHFGMCLSDASADPSPDRRMQAHAWLTIGETAVVGGPASAGFTVLARFTHETATAPPIQ